MMETKLWIALCALLLTNLGSTEEGDDNAAPSSASKTAPGGGALPKAADSVPGSSPDPINHAATMPSPNGSDTNPSSRGTNSSSSNTTTEGETISLTHEPKKDNGTNIVSPSEAAIPVNNKNLPDHLTSQPPIPPSGSHTPTSPIPLTSNTTNATHTAHNAPADTPTTTPLTDTSHRAATPLPDSITPSNKPTRPKTHSSTSVPHATTPEPPTPEAATTTTIAQSSSTSSISSSQETPNSESPTLTSPQNTSRPDGHPETSGEFHTKSASTAQAKAQADTHSQLNVGGETTMVHESATLDPLLAGLVSAFIITAVIITLLLFLKLRRRDNRPEFRRLQDLPMDDMMEDTPLSMYSY